MIKYKIIWSALATYLPSTLISDFGFYTRAKRSPRLLRYFSIMLGMVIFALAGMISTYGLKENIYGLDYRLERLLAWTLALIRVKELKYEGSTEFLQGRIEQS